MKKRRKKTTSKRRYKQIKRKSVRNVTKDTSLDIGQKGNSILHTHLYSSGVTKKNYASQT